MSFNEYCEKNNITINSKIIYTERATQDMKKAHFDEEMLKKILSESKKIETTDNKVFIIHGKRTAKMKVEIGEDSSIIVHWLEYNKVPMFG